MIENPFRLGLLELPESPDLGLGYLAAIFKKRSTSYKFYWFLAILEVVKNQETRISFDLLTAEMITQAWYPIHYYRLSLGKQELLTMAAMELKEKHGVPIDANREEVRDAVLIALKTDRAFRNTVLKLQRYVPERLIAPWFQSQLNGVNEKQKNAVIHNLANQENLNSQSAPLYRFVRLPSSEGDNPGIELHAHWQAYLFTNFQIIRGFILWHLIDYLYTRNPNVPNIPEKLFPPQKRNLSIATTYWKQFLVESPKNMCIYSRKPLMDSGFSLDHFIPWSFICHDQLWNLIPVSKPVNSSKGDRLPQLAQYLEPLSEFQFRAMRFYFGQETGKLPKILEDYANLFRCNFDELKQMEYSVFQMNLSNALVPLEQIAANMGFSRNWSYSSSHSI